MTDIVIDSISVEVIPLTVSVNLIPAVVDTAIAPLNLSVDVQPLSIDVDINPIALSVELTQSEVTQSDDSMFNQFVQLGEDIEAFKAVYLSNGMIYTATADDTNKCHVYGILLESGLQGQSRMVQIGGVVNNTNWNWSDNSNSKVYLGLNGNITQSVPNSGALIELGYPVSSSSILLDIEEAIML